MMQVKETRTLPPLVRGKVTGVLDFFVDEIKIFSNILVFTDNCDFVVQVQWWGEVFPVFLRPKKLHLTNITHKTYGYLKSYCHSATYEIKTTSDLFKLYLNTCEVLELPVLEAVDMCVIGSAFLKDLISILNCNNEPIITPLINYLGDTIGELKMHVNYSEKQFSICDKSETIQNKENKIPFKTSIYSQRECKSLENINTYNFSPTHKTIFVSESFPYSNKSDKSHKIFDLTYTSSNKKLSKDLISSNKENTNFEQNDRNLFEITKKSAKHIKDTSNLTDLVSSKSSDSNKKFPHNCLPEVHLASDSSKVIYFGLGLSNGQNKLSKKPFNSDLVKKNGKNLTNISTTKKFESVGKVKTFKPKPKSDRVVSTKNSEKNTRTRNHTLEKFAEKQDCKTSCKDSSLIDTLKTDKSIDENNHFVNESFQEECSNKKVLDYLLGTEMSKADEEKALTDFKKMSPSHNFVSSITQLYSVSENSFPNSKPSSMLCTDETTLPEQVKVHPLNFDLSNPIEKNYFETFFAKSNSVNDFKIAEFLNQPSTDILLKKCETSDKLVYSDSAKKKNIKCSKEEIQKESSLINDKLFKNVKSSVPNEKGEFEDKSNCSQCKYFKKLGELDDIIESLKHFQKKIINEEKNANQKSTLKPSPVKVFEQKFS